MDFLGEEYKQLVIKREEARNALKSFLTEYRKNNVSLKKPTDEVFLNEQNRLQQEFNDSMYLAFNYLKELEIYTKFDSYIIGVITDLISTYEGVQHVFGNVVNEKEEKRNNAVNKYKERITFITPYYVSKKHMVARGLVLATEKLALDDESLGASSISFYCVGDDELKPRVNFDKFPYAKDFIDSVIKYRITYNCKEISEDVVRAIMKQFLENRVEAIELYQATNFQKGPLSTVNREDIMTGFEDIAPKL